MDALLLTDANQMRILLDQVAYGHKRIDGLYADEECSFDMTSALTRRIFDLARFTGLSGEDKMTVLAYHALLQLQKMTKMNIDHLMVTPAKKFMCATPEKKNG